MATSAAAQAELWRLRRDIARIEGRLAEAERLRLDEACPGEAAEPPGPAGPGSRRIAPAEKGGSREPEGSASGKHGRLRLGVAALDRTLGGGLPLAALHEIRAPDSRDGGVASGFALALAARVLAAGRASVIWISEADSRRETGRIYPPGLAALGLDPSRMVEVAARTQKEALWAFEAALACRGVGAAICELREASLDLTATRRCALRARDAGVTGLLLRLAGRAEPSAAELRFRLSPAPAGSIGRYHAGVGRMAWSLALEKNRGGRTGVFTVEWDSHERCFAEYRAAWRSERTSAGPREAQKPHPQPLSAAADDRSSPAAAAGRGGERAAAGPVS